MLSRLVLFEKFLIYNNLRDNYMNMQKMGLKQKGTNQAAIRQRYGLQYLRFIEGEFTYSTHQLLKRICQNGQKQPYMYGVPLYKIMLQVVKIMMMNELETLFLASTLQEMKWKITDVCLNDYIEEAGDITPRLQKDAQAKKVQFSLLLISYIVKIYLNQDNSLIDFKIRDIIKNGFDRMYQTWVQRVSSNFKFNPKSMNRIFKEFDTKQQDKNHQIIDYNKLVSQFFRQNQTTQINQQRDNEVDFQQQRFYQMENSYNRQTNKPHRQQKQDNYKEIYRGPSRDQDRRNDILDLPLEEEQEIEIPGQSHRKYSSRLNRQISEIGFQKRQSVGNQFFAPQPTSRPNILRLQMFRSSSIAEQSPQR